MKENFETQELALARVAEIDKLFGFPDDKLDTLTYAIPFEEEDGTWSIEIGPDLQAILYEEVKEVIEEEIIE